MKEPDDKIAEWPKGVEPISYGNIGRLGVDRANALYWDGKPIEIQRRLKFSSPQLIAAVLIGIATIVGGLGTGLNEGVEFGCKLHWWTQECQP